MLITKKPVDDTKLTFPKMGTKPTKFNPADERVKASLGAKPTKKTAKKGKSGSFALKAATALAAKK